jgi:hypothetical protein
MRNHHLKILLVKLWRILIKFLLPLVFKDLEVPKLRLGILKTSKHGNETSNFKDLMVVRFSAVRIKNDNIETRRNYTIFVSRQRSTDELSYFSFVQTDLNKFDKVIKNTAWLLFF